RGFSVVLFEKNTYPFHKVCGEYISMESRSFLERIGLPLQDMNLPVIDALNVTNVDGLKISSPLEMGGFGISRYTLDYELVKLARRKGVDIMDGTKVNDVEADGIINSIYTSKGVF